MRRWDGLLVALLLVLGLFVLLRARFVGHLLTWDEAMALCTARSFVAGDHDCFSLWFWRHPPLYSCLTLTLWPLQPDFAERVEWLTVLVSGFNALLLYLLNARLFGRLTAIWSCFLLAIMPGANLFDAWIKTDHLVTTFGLLALLCVALGRNLWAGLCLGCAFLSKETALFYLMAAILICAWSNRHKIGLVLRSCLLLLVVPILVAGWWFVLFQGRQDLHSSLEGIANHLDFATAKDALWSGSFFYYFRELPILVGWHGVILSMTGAVLCLWPHARSRPAPAGAAGFWPLALLGSSYALISVVPNKVPWIVISLLPAWATLQARAVSAALEVLAERLHLPPKRCLAAHALTLIGMGLAFPPRYDYNAELAATVPQQYVGARRSRDIAETLDALVKPGQRVLLSSFAYWKGIPPGTPCAVFTYYFHQGRDVSVLIRPHTATGEDLVKDVIRYQIDWAVLSPPTGQMEKDVLEAFEARRGLRPVRLDRAWIFPTTQLQQRPAAR